MKTIVVIGQTLLVILLAPLIGGFIRKIKNNLRMRKGAPVLQPYYNLSKLFIKQEVVSDNSSWIFKITPFIVLGAAVTALLLVPFFHTGFSLSNIGDFFALIFILSLGRFFLALAGLDTASSFGGMGSSREMFLSSLVEPTAILAVMAVSLNAGSTNLEMIANVGAIPVSSLLAALALFLVTIVETGRIPIDNQETHLELTMIHEAMVLEYSGRSLAMIELAAYIKQAIFFSLIAGIILPFSIVYPFSYAQVLAGFALFGGEIVAIAVITAVTEVSIAKMRLFRAVDFLAFSFALGIMAVVAQSIRL
jgi:formate hydrogenlyase subunit 4